MKQRSIRIFFDEHPIKAPATEKLIFWSVAFILLSQMSWWIALQIRESKRLQEARIATMRAGRAEAWLFDANNALNLPKNPSEGSGIVVGQMPGNWTLEMRKQAIEARFPYVSVQSEPGEEDDPVLLADQIAYLSLRQDKLALLERERVMALWRAVGEALVMVGAVFFGMTYIYRKLNAEMELMLRQRNFIASVTHELKTPITSLRVWMETLFGRELSLDQRERIHVRMDGDLHRLNDLVANLLQTARADAGGLDIRPEPTDLGPWLIQVCENMDHRMGERQLGLQLRLSEGIWASIDPKAFAMVIENLLSNAYKYASVPRNTIVTLDGNEDEAFIAISDQGNGLEAKEVGKIFQRFYRVGDEMTRSVPGTGLGLFLCREIVRAHGGEIRASSRGLGMGTQLTLSLDRVQASEIEESSQAQGASSDNRGA